MGITRDTVIQLAKDRGIPVHVGRLTLGQLVSADEVVFSGTASEITPIREIDGRKNGNGKPGQIARGLQKKYLDLVHWEVQGYDEWVSYMPKKLQKGRLQAVEI